VGQAPLKLGVLEFGPLAAGAAPGFWRFVIAGEQGIAAADRRKGVKFRAKKSRPRRRPPCRPGRQVGNGVPGIISSSRPFGRDAISDFVYFFFFPPPPARRATALGEGRHKAADGVSWVVGSLPLRQLIKGKIGERPAGRMAATGGAAWVADCGVVQPRQDRHGQKRPNQRAARFSGSSSRGANQQPVGGSGRKSGCASGEGPRNLTGPLCENPRWKGAGDFRPSWRAAKEPAIARIMQGPQRRRGGFACAIRGWPHSKAR